MGRFVSTVEIDERYVVERTFYSDGGHVSGYG